jgi:O-antigen/teichoic acid export membrane protein
VSPEPQKAAPAAAGSLALRAAQGVRWTTTGMLVMTALQFVQVATLARILPKTDFGLMAMMTVVLAFAAAYADMGLTNAIVHRQDTTRDQLSSLYWLNVAAGACVFAVIVAITPLVAAFYREPRLKGLLPIAAVIFLITPFGQQFQALLQKRLRFRLIATIDMTAAVIGATTAVVCALSGLGVLSLIGGQLAMTGARAAGLCSFGWRSERPRLHFRWSDTRGYVKFGLYQMGERSVNQLSANLDYLIIGRILGPAVLGPYAIAYQLSVMPMLKINPVLTRVAFPIFALRQGDRRALTYGYERVVGLLVFGVFPLLVGLVVLAPLVVPVVFGPGWTASIPLVQVLGLMALFKTLSNPSGSVFLAIGKASLGFWLNIGVGVSALCGFSVAAYFGGVLAVAWTWVGIAGVMYVIILLFLRHHIGLDLRHYFVTIRRPLLIVFAMGAVVLAASRGVSTLGMGQLGSLVCLAVLGVAVYGGIWVLVDRAHLVEVLRVITGRTPREET